MVFGYFLPKQKVARAVGRRGKRHGRQLSRSKGTGFRVLACGQPRNDECFALASRVKMLERVRTLTRPSGTLSRGERDSKRGKVGVRRDQPLRSRVGEVHLDAGVRAGAFRADHHAFTEAGVADALAEFDGQGVVEIGVAT